MRRILPVIAATPLLVIAVMAQPVNLGMSTGTRTATAVLGMDGLTIASEGPSESQTFEQADDPTVVAHAAPPHDPLRAARIAAKKGEHLAKKKRGDEAIAKYQEAVALDPLYFEAWNNLALELEAAGKKDEAEQVFRRLMQSNPEHVLVFTNLAALLTAQKRYAEAEAVARQAMKLHSYSFKANLVLGCVLIDEGKWSDEAKTKLEYAQVRYPEAKTLLNRWPDSAAKAAP